MHKKVFVTVGATLLASCGGSSTSEAPIAVVPAPITVPVTPTPTPSPTPVPLPTGMTLLNFSGVQQFDTLVSMLQYDRASTGVVTVDTRYFFAPSNGLDFSSDRSSGLRSFFFLGSNVPPHNTPQNDFIAPFKNSSRLSSDSAFTNYRITDGGATYTLQMLNPGPGNARLSLSYVGVGVAEGVAATANGAGIATDFRAFGYGFPAEQSAVPLTGMGQYSGFVIGRAVGASGANIYALSGTLNVTLDFAAQTFAGAVVLSATDTVTGEVVSLGSFPLATQTTYGTPLNSISSALGTGINQFRAKLAGNTAEEMEGSFNLTVPDPRAPGVTLKIVGAVAARR